MLRPRFQICWRTARRASPWGWRRRSRPQTRPNSAMRRSALINPGGLRIAHDLRAGPGLPDGRRLVESRDPTRKPTGMGRGSFRVRARWHKEETTRGGWVIVVTEIPYLVPKARLIEKTAGAAERAQAAHAGRYPRRVRGGCARGPGVTSRTVDPALLMEGLFQLTELDSRISMNMNALTGGLAPRVLGLQ